tara:strand:- start:2599 stop:3552 length:954 start_codon:yes stop_codon:yes gene_type:complete
MTTFAHSKNHYTNALDDEKNEASKNNIIKKSHSGVAVKLIGSQQDWVIKGSNTKFRFIVVLDGHGKGNVINHLKTLDWNKILIENEYADQVLLSINEFLSCDKNGKIADNFRDGSTCSIVKQYDTYIECYTIGDSQVGIKINDKYFYTVNHDADNTDEVKRLSKEYDISITDTWKGRILNNTDMTMIPGKYFDFPNTYRSSTDRIAMTRSLGHNYGNKFSTLQQFEIFRIDYTQEDDVVIIAATDGLWDVVHDKNNILETFYNEAKAVSGNTALTRLINRTENKWMQKWNYCWKSKIVEQTKIPNPDDIGIAYLANY